MEFKNSYFFLSTFYKCDVVAEIKGKSYTFKNLEAAFQAHKNPDYAAHFVLLPGLQAKKLGEQIKPVIEAWDLEQIRIMAKLLHSKFRNYALMFQLKLIEGDIIQDNFWHDTFWGKYKGEGRNILGKLLTVVRDSNNDFQKILDCANTEILKICLNRE